MLTASQPRAGDADRTFPPRSRYSGPVCGGWRRFFFVRPAGPSPVHVQVGPRTDEGKSVTGPAAKPTSASLGTTVRLKPDTYWASRVPVRFSLSSQHLTLLCLRRHARGIIREQIPVAHELVRGGLHGLHVAVVIFVPLFE